MMSRHTYLHILAFMAILLALSSCVEPFRTNGFEEEDLYTIHFQVRTQDNAMLTKVGGPISGIDSKFDELYMYCFDENGLFLGRFPAKLGTKEELNYTDLQDPGTFTGQIPPATCRVHFVANANCPVGNDMIGLTEEEIMHAPGLVCSDVNSRMAYWGYLRRDDHDVLASLFSSGDALVYMVRDRLIITAGTIDAKLSDVSWVVYNGLSHGYIASYGKTKGVTNTEHPNDWFDEDNPYQEVRYTLVNDDFTLSTELTAYPEEGRFTRGESDMVPFNSSNPMYVFDDECPVTDASRVVKLIVKATVKTGESTGETRFFPICITDGYDSEPIPLKRGHIYQLDMRAMPPAAGYGSFSAAAQAHTFANGAIVDIPGEVIEVSDGKFDMKVNYELRYPLSRESFNSTAILLQSTKATETIDFTVNKKQGDNQLFYFVESDWLKDESTTIPVAHDINRTVTWGDGITTGTDPNTHKQGAVSSSTDGVGSEEDEEALHSSITLPLLEVGDNLKQSVYNLKGYYWGTINDQPVKHILMRNIYVFTINKFQINGTPTLERIGTSSNYRLKFKLPSGNNSYPELLYPLQIKMATKTLEPTAISIGNGTAAGQVSQQNPVFGVQVRSTVGAPSNIVAQSTTVQQWDYQEAGNYWDFWYAYSVTSIPKYTSANASQDHPVGEVISGPEIWIDFKDIRDAGGFSTATRPIDVGLYLYIEFFGSAVAVSTNP